MKCKECGANLPYDAYGNIQCQFCNAPNYVPIPEKKVEVGMEKPVEEKPSNLWYLVPLFLGIIGGIVAYFALRNRDKKMAKNTLIIGVVVYIFYFVIITVGIAIFSSNSGSSIKTDYSTPKTTTIPPPFTKAPFTTSLISDSFNSNENEWYTGSTSTGQKTEKISLLNGKYRWERKVNTGTVAWQIPKNIEKVSDFHLNVEAKQISGPENANYGVVFRKIDGNFYRFSINNNQKYTLKLFYNGEWKSLIGWTKSSAIRAGDVNKLEVIAEGSQFRLLINNQYISDISDNRLISGELGVMISSNADEAGVYEFDNFKVTTTAPTTIAPTTTTAPTITQPTTKPAPTTSAPITIKPATHFLIYDNPTYGFRIKYPVEWKKQENVAGAIVVFLSQEGYSVNVVTEDISHMPMTLTEYADISINQLSMLMPDFNLISSRRVVLANIPAHQIVYTYQQEQFRTEFKNMQVFTIKDNIAYVISYGGMSVQYSGYLSTVDEMIDSFEIVSQAPTTTPAPSSPDAVDYYSSGLEYASTPNYEYSKAISEFTKAIEIDPNYADAYYARGLSYQLLEEYSKALSDYNKYIEFEQNVAGVYFSRGSIYFILEDYSIAISDFTKAIELDPKYALAYELRGDSYKALGETEKAKLDHDKAGELDPKYR